MPSVCRDYILRVHFMQQWLILSDPVMEEVPHDVPLIREFTNLTRDGRLPGESTILAFGKTPGPRHLLECEKLAEQMRKAVKDLLQAKGLLLNAGTVVDATRVLHLMRATDRQRVGADATPLVQFESALALGDVWALDQLWREVGFDALAGVFRKALYATPIERALRVMVFNRLCDPESNLGVLRWLATVSLPEVDTAAMTHQHLLRSMDALMTHQDAVDEVVVGCGDL